MPKILFMLLNGVLFVFAFFLATISVIVHFSTYLLSEYPDIFSEPFVPIIVLSIFFPFIVMVIMIAITQNQKESKNTSVNGTVIPSNTSEGLIPEKNKLVYKIVILCFFYAIFLIISYFWGSFDYDEYWHFCPARDNILVANEVD